MASPAVHAWLHAVQAWSGAGLAVLVWLPVFYGELAQIPREIRPGLATAARLDPLKVLRS